MASIESEIEAAPGADGPFMVTTRKEGAVTNCTLGIANRNLALDQAKTDHGTVLTGPPVLTWKKSTLITEATG